MSTSWFEHDRARSKVEAMKKVPKSMHQALTLLTAAVSWSGGSHFTLLFHACAHSKGRPLVIACAPSRRALPALYCSNDETDGS
jgi:hypothetical protein